MEARSFDSAGNESVAASRNYKVENESPSGSCTGVQVSPSSNLQALVDANPQGATFCIRPGVHRFTQSVVPKSGNIFIGEPGAILSGASDITGSFTQSGSAWVASGMTMEGAGNPGWPDPCIGGGTLCLRTNDVYYDDRFLTRVGSLGELSSGEFFFDYGSDRIYIADSPAGHKVEVSVAQHALRSWGTGATGVTMRNIVIEKFATPASDGAIQGGGDWVLDGLTVRLNHSLGVNGFRVFRNGLVYDNGQQGVTSGYGDGEIVEELRVRQQPPHPDHLLARWRRQIQAQQKHDHPQQLRPRRHVRWSGHGLEQHRDASTKGIVSRTSAALESSTRRPAMPPSETTSSVEPASTRHGLDRRLRHQRSRLGERRGLRQHAGGQPPRDRWRQHRPRAPTRTAGRSASQPPCSRQHHQGDLGATPEGNWRVASGVVGDITQPFAQQAFFDRNTYTACAQNLMAGPNALRLDDLRVSDVEPVAGDGAGRAEHDDRSSAETGDPRGTGPATTPGPSPTTIHACVTRVVFDV